MSLDPDAHVGGWTKRRLGRLGRRVALLLIAAAVCAAEPQDIRFVVRVYNYAGLPDQLVNRAEREATGLFSDPGVEPVWVSCPQSPECPTTAGFTLNLLQEGAPAVSDKRHPFGYALGQTAWIHVDSLRPVVDSRLASWPAVLGHVMAHELGHLLLGADSHAADGVMRARFGVSEWNRVSRGRIRFSASEGERMRASLLRPRL